MYRQEYDPSIMDIKGQGHIQRALRMVLEHCYMNMLLQIGCFLQSDEYLVLQHLAAVQGDDGKAGNSHRPTRAVAARHNRGRVRRGVAGRQVGGLHHDAARQAAPQAQGQEHADAGHGDSGAGQGEQAQGQGHGQGQGQLQMLQSNTMTDVTVVVDLAAAAPSSRTGVL